jgi:hypothetical protein
LKKTAPQDITLSTPIDLFLRLKRKSYKSDWEYLRTLEFIEKENCNHNYANSIANNAKIIKTIKYGSQDWENITLYDKYNDLDTNNQYTRNLIKHQAKKQTEWLFKKTRDFDDRFFSTNEFYLMKLKQLKRKRF